MPWTKNVRHKEIPERDTEAESPSITGKGVNAIIEVESGPTRRSGGML